MIDEARNNPSFGKHFYDMITAGHSVLPPHNTIRQICSVVEQSHADVVNLLLVDSLKATSLTQRRDWNNPSIQLDILKDAAQKLGYRLTKLPKSQQED